VRSFEIIGCPMPSAQQGDHRNDACSTEVFLDVLPSLMGVQIPP
jgi:hypothetical protein